MSSMNGRGSVLLTEEDLQHKITRRRSLSGESYETARDNLLKYLVGSGQISQSEYEHLKRIGKPRI